MSDRSVALTTIRGGINRQRAKGAALNDSLYDLLNGYVTKARTIKVRPGTFREYVLPEGNTLTDSGPTHGLVSFEGSLHVFATDVETVPAGFTLHVIRHPDDLDTSNPTPITKIHFAAPFLGFLYVVAEFEETTSENGNIFHFWLQQGEEWAANTVYEVGDIVHPSVANGFSYRATRLSAANPAWAPSIVRAANDVIEPTVYNGYQYTAVTVSGANPRSGLLEPTWPTEDGAQVSEFAEGSVSNTAEPTTQPDPEATPDGTTQDRYGHFL